MKEIIAIIRPKKSGPTKVALDELGFPSMTAIAVLGRGVQHGISGEVKERLSRKILANPDLAGVKYIAKRLFSVMVSDGDVDKVVNKIIEVNQTAQIGDGKIFVCPLDDAIRVRTGERGDSAIV